MPHVRTIALAAVLVALAACGDAAGESAAPSRAPTAPAGAPAASEAQADEDGHDDMHGMDEHAADFAFGRPGAPAEADRTIEVRTDNELAFDPAQVTVAAGETVTFAVSNHGDLQHDFVIGDDAAQAEHAREMSEMAEGMEMEGAEHGDANAVSVPPGETVELTWTFDGATAGVTYACHEPGHYAAGMVGEILVEG